VTATTKIIRL